MENRTAEEQIHARLRELADELRQLRRELSEDQHRRNASQEILKRRLISSPPPKR